MTLAINKEDWKYLPIKDIQDFSFTKTDTYEKKEYKGPHNEHILLSNSKIISSHIENNVGVEIDDNQIIFCKSHKHTLNINDIISLKDGESSQSRIDFVVEDGVYVKVLFTIDNISQANYLNNIKINSKIGNNATFEFYLLHHDHVQNAVTSLNYIQVETTLQKDANFTFFSNCNSLRARIENKIIFTGKNSCSNSYFLEKVSNKQKIDIAYDAIHNVPHCESHAYSRAIASDSASFAFTGKIYVEKMAAKTNANFEVKNLNLSKRSKVFARPQLEIYNDDVKCTHGAATGKIDEDSLFYLKSRGISHTLAQQMLIDSFTSIITDKITCPILKEQFINNATEI